MNAIRSCLAALLIAAAAPAWSHGAAGHSKPTQVSKEQKDWGVAGEQRAVKRTIELRMTDNMRFTPDTIDVRQGETVRLLIHNRGAMLHEFVLGTPQELKEHAELMLKFPNMEHDAPYMAHVAPGKTGEIIWTFNRVGVFDFACLLPGHYQTGMVGKVRVKSP